MSACVPWECLLSQPCCRKRLPAVRGNDPPANRRLSLSRPSPADPEPTQRVFWYLLLHHKAGGIILHGEFWKGTAGHHQWAGEASCRPGQGLHTPPWDSLLAHQPGLRNREREAHAPGGRSGNCHWGTPGPRSASMNAALTFTSPSLTQNFHQLSPNMTNINGQEIVVRYVREISNREGDNKQENKRNPDKIEAVQAA